MIVGILSDTHGTKLIPQIMEEFEKRNVSFIVHCGDIEPQHVDQKLFLGLPVVCALNAEQLGKPGFPKAPPGWTFTVPGERIIDICHTRTYVGHKRAYDFVNQTEQGVLAFLEELRKDNDGLRWVFSGHTHHQIFAQTPLVNFLNPGAVAYSFDGAEFAVVDTENRQIVFSRIQNTKPTIPTFSVGVISDSSRISDLDPGFWAKLAEELAERDASTIIHCGNIAVGDIGRPELKNFSVYFNLRPDQLDKVRQPVPPNWHLIGENGEPVVEINGYRFYIELDLGISLLKLSEMGMKDLYLELRRRFHELDFVLCGFTHNALLVEGEGTRIINPGDIIKDRNFAVICLPRDEITFGHVPLPE